MPEQPMTFRSRPADRYDPHEIEPRWQTEWLRTRLYETDLHTAGSHYYNLMMFPYPSAEGLHVGNVYAFTGADIHGRFMAMQGRNVFEPIGFDAFGIHSENFAIQRGIHPRILTARNVERFRAQLRRIGNRFDWSHEVETSDPAYYRWTQWIFTRLFNAGLAVRKQAPVNWCPTDKTVLADEQVIDGRCERCDTLVVQRELEQWFFRITAFAQRLLNNLAWIDWSSVVTTAQRNWIGRSEGLEFELAVEGRAETITVFTTRPDTVFGMTYVVLAPEHPLAGVLATDERRPAVEAYRETARRKSELERVAAGTREKTGEATGAFAINPANGAHVPIWIADYVLTSYGAGAIMAVPAHDQRDFAFATTFGLPLRPVVVPAPAGQEPARPREADAAYIGHGILVDSGEFTGQPSEAAGERIIAWFEARGLGRRSVQFRLRDWLVSRQRYWGPPIPIVYCDACGVVAVPDDQLPVLLPELEDWLPTGTGTSPLAQLPAFVSTTCPTCGGPARRETDVSDNFLDSAWFFLRYPSTGFDDRAFDPELTRTWLPVDMYVGGPEHSVLHLLYSRFIAMALHDLGYLEFEEPFSRFYAHGHLTKAGAKMSKSRGNAIAPDQYIDRYGADTLRMYLMFLGPYDQGGDFDDRGIGGIQRFLRRTWDLIAAGAHGIAPGSPLLPARRNLHRTIQKVAEDLRALKYNTAIAALMEYLRALQRQHALHDEEARSFLLLLAPLAPHITEELWARLGQPYSIHQQRFPEAEPDLLAEEESPVAVQVNGRTRAVVQLSPSATEQEALAAAMALPALRPDLAGVPIRRLVYVPGRVLNIVV